MRKIILKAAILTLLLIFSARVPFSTTLAEPLGASGAPPKAGKPPEEQPGPASPAGGEEEYMAIEKIVPGMKGYGLTVFEGTKVERFEVEVLGVLKNVWPKGDIILVRAEHPMLSKTNIISGMSGSPVYIEDKLAGALAFSWYFSKEPIAGVTPIQDMLKLVDADKAGKSVKVARRIWPRGESIHRVLLRGRFWPAPAGPKESPGEAERGHLSLPQALHTLGLGREARGFSLEPLAIPIAVSGVSENTLALLERNLGPLGLIFTQGEVAGTTAKDEKRAEELRLEPGAVVCVKFMEGDLSMSGMGTVTAKIGERVLCFGHALLGEGSVDLPMALGVIHSTMPRQNVSFKIFSPLKTVGRFTQDQRSGLLGRMGEVAKMVPVTLAVNSESGEETYNLKVIDHPLITPWLLGSAVYDVLSAQREVPYENTLQFEVNFALEKRDPIIWKDAYAGPGSAQGVAQDVVSLAGILLNNPFTEVKITEMHLSALVVDRQESAVIESVQVEKREVEPGEVLKVKVRLRPYKGEAVEREVEIEVPEDAAPGKRMLSVSDFATSEMLDVSEAPGRYQPRDLEGLLKILREEIKPRDLVVRLSSVKAGLVISGHELPRLPGSVFHIMSYPRKTGVSTAFESVKSEQGTRWVLSGYHKIPIEVVKKVNR